MDIFVLRFPIFGLTFAKTYDEKILGGMAGQEILENEILNRSDRKIFGLFNPDSGS